MYQKQDLLAQLAQLGVPRDRPVLVHSSLRAVGAVEGGGKSVLDALIAHITAEGGLCCLPTHTWHLIGQDVPTLDLAKNETCVGALTRLALDDGRGVRTCNPTHSMVVFGDRARVEAFVAGEEKQVTHTSPDGCYGKLWREDGFVLLVGVGHAANTYLHCVEEVLGVKDRIASAPIDVSVRDLAGRITHRLVYTFDEAKNGDVSLRFPKFEPAFRAHGCIADGMLGDAPTQLCSARGMKRVLERIYAQNGGRELLGDDEPLDPTLYETKGERVL